jgi:HK97 family phage portal protein
MLLGDEVSGGGPQVPGEQYYDWFFAGTTSALLHGTSWGLVTNRSGIPGADGLGLPTGIAWLPPERMSVQDDEQQPENPLRARIYYNGRQVDRSQLVIMKAFSVAGRVEGISPMRAFAQLYSQGLHALDYSASWFENGGFPPGAFRNINETVDESQSKVIRRQLTDTIRLRQPLVFGADWEYTPISVPVDEAIFVTGMQLNATQVASVYGVQPWRVGGTRAEGMTYSNVTMNQLDELQTTLRPWLRRWEHLLTSLLPSTQYAKFDVDEYLRMDPRTRNEVYQIQRNIGTRTAEEIRADDDRPPLEGGDDPIPLLMLERMASTTRLIPKSVLPLVDLEADLVADKLQEMETEHPELVNPMTADKPPLQKTPEQYLGGLMTQVRGGEQPPSVPRETSRPFGPDNIRAGNDDRLLAVRLLQVHESQGRLQPGEMEDRSRKASEAVTCGDLATLFTDLPAISLSSVRPVEHRGERDDQHDDQPMFGPAALALLHQRAMNNEAADLAATNGKVH